MGGLKRSVFDLLLRSRYRVHSSFILLTDLAIAYRTRRSELQPRGLINRPVHATLQARVCLGCPVRCASSANSHGKKVKIKTAYLVSMINPIRPELGFQFFFGR